MKLSERMFARAERTKERGDRAYAMFLRQDAEEVVQLEAKLAAHIDNEGDECPLCVLEAENERLHRFLTTREYEDRVQLEEENEALSKLLFALVDVELERDKYADLLRHTTCLGCMLTMLECRCEEGGHVACRGAGR